MHPILLTGAAGFIGARTAQFLLEKNTPPLIAIDNLNDYYFPKLKTHRLESLKKFPHFKFFNNDVENLSSLEELFNHYRFSAVYHLAARAGVRYSQQNPHVYFTTNVSGTLNLLECMRRYGAEKLILASTSSLYAGLPLPFTEDLPVNTPISPYAASKKSAESLAYTYHHLYKIDVSILRYFTVYGPAGRPDMSPYRFIQWIDQGLPIQLYGDGSQSRDFTYIDDIAQGTLLSERKLGFEVINLGGGQKPYSIKHLIQLVEDVLKKKAKIEYHPFEKTDAHSTWADISKAKKLLNWEPIVDLEEGIGRSVQWYLENKHWLPSI